MKSAVVILAAAATVGGAQDKGGSEGAPSFPVGVEQVIVDVVVSDRASAAVGTLTARDFELTEDGDRQTIVSFEHVEVPPLPASTAEPPPPPPVSTNAAELQRTGRTFLVVFDDLNMEPLNAQKAKGAVNEFLNKGTTEGDRVMLVATSGAIWWSERMEAGRPHLLAQVKRLDGRYIPESGNERMSDTEAYMIYVNNDSVTQNKVRQRWESLGVAQRTDSTTSNTGMPGETDPEVSAKALEVYMQASIRVRTTLDVVERAVAGLEDVRGRKSVVLVSQGFFADPTLEGFRKVANACRRSNAAIYMLDIRGLQAMHWTMSAEVGPPISPQGLGSLFFDEYEASAGSEALVSDSGGFSVKNTNDLGKGIQKIADESRSYYLLGYNSTNPARDGKFRKIKVRLGSTGPEQASRKGWNVKARRGYYAPFDTAVATVSSSGKPKVDPKFQRAIDAPGDYTDIPMRATAYVGEETMKGKALCVIMTEIDVRGLSFREEQGRSAAALDLLVGAIHRESGESFRDDQRVSMKLLPATRERLNKTWYAVSREFDLPAGSFRARIVVREVDTGRVGSVSHTFTVPDTGSLRVSSPIITNALEPAAAGERLQPQIVAHRDFPPEGTLYMGLEVFGATRDAKNAMPKVSMGYEVHAPSGRVLTAMEPSVISPTSLGKLSRLVGFSLTGADPGEYRITAKVKDEISGKQVEFNEPFTVHPATP